MKRIILITIIAVIGLFNLNTAIAQEKPLVIKGLFIGMETTEAKQILMQLLPHNWTISQTGETYKVLLNYRTGNSEIFGNLGTGYLYAKFCPGATGFAIIRDNFYEGYISTDKSGNKVTRITLSGTITDQIYSSAKIDAENFASAFWKNYNMPDFNWIPYGWQYISPMGYTVTIMTDKLIDIKKSTLDRK
jgi:hypothetical protein